MCPHDWGSYDLPHMTSPEPDLISQLTKVMNAVGLASDAKRRPDLVSIIRMKDRFLNPESILLMLTAAALGILAPVLLESETMLR